MKTGKKEEGRGKRSGDGKDALLSVPSDTVESLRAHVSRLHAERGEAVLEAKKAREEQGVKSAAFQLDWQKVENLTRAIVHYEAELEKAQADHKQEEPAPQGVDNLLYALHETSTLHAYENGKTAQQLRAIIERASLNARKAINDFLQGRKKLNPLMRDPAVELPDAGISVLVRLDNEEFQFAIGEYDGAIWTESGDPINCAIRSWCHMDEAAEALKAATREARP